MSLRLIDLSHFEAALMALVNRCCESSKGPVALFAAREVKNDECYFDDAGAPVLREPGGEIGSEGATGFILTRLGRANKSLLISPSIDAMRKKCCRRLVLVDDLVGSGTRMRRFSDAIYAHKTIKSWRSYGLIDGVAVAYAASVEGEELVLNGEGPIWEYFEKRKRWRRNRLLESLRCERRPEGDTLWWAVDTKRAVKALCYKYSKSAKLSDRYALGVNDTLGTLVFEHGCTNVTPGILWQSTSKKWNPLFPMRTIPPDIRALFRKRPPVKATLARLRRIGYTRIEEREQAVQQTPTLPVDLALLLAAATKLRTAEKIATFLGLERSECDRMIALARAHGFLDDATRLTDLGRGELRRLGRDPHAPEENLPSNEAAIYIPDQLRGSTTS